ncbi:MAG TPA: class I SAM-dependent methyltransferase, partial [Gemmatimonadales bacterium]|nr:class I SAM-dependent methyltransferase [Gemmatimonadales bacterium]
MSTLAPPAIDQHKLEAFLDRAVGDLAAAYGGVMVSLGRRLELYRAMAGAGPLNSHEVAARSGCAERYVREWLNSQAAGGYVVHHPTSGTYELPPEQALVLADDRSPVYLPPAWEVPASMWLDEERAVHAFRTGEGIPWGEHNDRLYCGVAAFYRNAYEAQLVQHWLPAVDGLTETLATGARVADVGCGYGISTILMAQAYPRSRFWGFDYHPESIEAARRSAAEAGVADRVTFQVASARDYAGGPYDLVCFFDCLHDMGDPVGAARHAREALGPGGTVVLVEPYAGDRVEDNLNPVGRLYYAASTTLCCAHSLSEEGGAALGAQAGEARLAEVFRRAGFGRFRRATETPFNLILEAHP